jgi:SEC-C motif-containing protein
VLDLLDYLLQTWAPQTRPDTLTPNEPGLRWLGLTLLEHQRTGLDTATVRFVARFKVGGRAQRLQEISRFERSADGRWFYVDGDMG